MSREKLEEGATRVNLSIHGEHGIIPMRSLVFDYISFYDKRNE
jgi:hypothetical protein